MLISTQDFYSLVQHGRSEILALEKCTLGNCFDRSWESNAPEPRIRKRIYSDVLELSRQFDSAQIFAIFKRTLLNSFQRGR